MLTSIYDKLRVCSPPWLRQWLKRCSLFTPLTKILFRNAVYSRSYYDDVERIEASSVACIADWIKDQLAPATVIDVGCGPGHLMAQLERREIITFGIDLSDEALARVSEKGLRAERFDLTAPFKNLPGTPYDLAVSCEVAEHLDAKYARTFVEKMSLAASVIYLTAAEPNQSIGPGLYHVNEQPNSYWIVLMKDYEFEIDHKATNNARVYLAVPEVVSYLQRPMIFRKRA